MKYFRCLALLLAVLLFSCSGENPLEPAGPEQVVNITGNKFLPSSVTISAGTTVRWINNDDDFHTVDHGLGVGQGADPPAFNLTVLEDESSRFTFNTAGTFPYYCIRHGETGTVTVTAQ